MSERSKVYSVDEWMPKFHTRTSSHNNLDHSWCTGSLKPVSGNGLICDVCKQEMKKYPKRDGVPTNLTRPHTKVSIERGLYLLRVGAVSGGGDWIKVGSAEKMNDRLFQHFRDKRHQHCEILHLTERCSNWKTTEAVEGLIVGRIRDEYPKKRLHEEYLPDLFNESNSDESLIRSAA